MLQGICNSYAEDAERKSKCFQDETSSPSFSLFETSSSSFSLSVPEILVVGFYGYDALFGPTPDLICHTITNFNKKFVAYLFAHGAPDNDNPSAKHIHQYFKEQGRLILFSAKTTIEEKLKRFREAKLHVLVSLTGWTNGCIAEILACRPAWLNFHWLGWAAPMYAPFIDYMVVGDALTEEQRKLPQGECYAQIGCYQPCQAHPYLMEQNLPKCSREDFNFPPNFLYCYPGNSDRLNENSVLIFWQILIRTPGSCFVFIETHSLKRINILKWIQKVDKFFDFSRLIFRRYVKKQYFYAMLKLVNTCVDDSTPRSLHTGTGDALSNGKLIVTVDNREFGMQGGVGAEIVRATGLGEFLVAVDEDDLIVKAVDLFTHREKREHLERVLQEQITAGIGYFKQDRVTRLLEYCFHTAVSSLCPQKATDQSFRT